MVRGVVEGGGNCMVCYKEVHEFLGVVGLVLQFDLVS